MAKVPSSGLEIKNVLIGLYKYQIEDLDKLREKYRRSRTELVREAVDLLLRGEEIMKGRRDATDS